MSPTHTFQFSELPPISSKVWFKNLWTQLNQFKPNSRKSFTEAYLDHCLKTLSFELPILNFAFIFQGFESFIVNSEKIQFLKKRENFNPYVEAFSTMQHPTLKHKKKSFYHNLNIHTLESTEHPTDKIVIPIQGIQHKLTLIVEFPKGEARLPQGNSERIFKRWKSLIHKICTQIESNELLETHQRKQVESNQQLHNLELTTKLEELRCTLNTNTSSPNDSISRALEKIQAWQSALQETSVNNATTAQALSSQELKKQLFSLSNPVDHTTLDNKFNKLPNITLRTHKVHILDLLHNFKDFELSSRPQGINIQWSQDLSDNLSFKSLSQRCFPQSVQFKNNSSEVKIWSYT